MASDLAQLRKDLIKHFGSVLEENEELLNECTNICQVFNMNAEDFFWKWEANNFNTKKGAFTLIVARDMKQGFQQEREKQAAAARRRQNVNSMLNRGTGRNLGAIMNMGRAAPSTPIKSELQSTPGFGAITPLRGSVSGPTIVKFSDGPSQTAEAKKGRAYRYMYEKISERSEMLDDRIDEFAEIFKEHYQIEDLGDPAATTEEDVYVMGRIALDAESSSEGSVKLNETSVVLESSRMMGSGARVPLRFEPSVKIRGVAKGSGNFGLFPGALVAVKGRNGGGGWFLVSELLALPPLKIREPETSTLNASSATLVIACGPFTPDSDLEYEPWRTLLTMLKTIKPAAILLTGPFIDADHPKIRDGEITQTPAQMFKSIFIDSLSKTLDLTPGSIALLVPSIRDILDDHAVLPQSELGANLVNDPRIHLLPNPTKFSLDGRTFAVTSVDVLFHIKKQEFLKSGEEVDPTERPSDASGTDAFAALCRHVLRHRSLYPVFPVPTELSHEVNLDVSHLDGLALTYDSDEPAADVLVLPSRYKQFCKTVDGTLVINPSFVSKTTFVTVPISSRGGTGVEIVKIQ